MQATLDKLPELLRRGRGEPVTQWRFDRLRAAGYSPGDAAVLAERRDVDLHLAVDLLQRGCSAETALRILL